MRTGVSEPASAPGSQTRRVDPESAAHSFTRALAKTLVWPLESTTDRVNRSF